MMEYQSSLHKKLSNGNFIFTSETTPPDTSSQEILLKKQRQQLIMESTIAPPKSSFCPEKVPGKNRQTF